MQITIGDNVQADAFTSLFQHIKIFTEQINITFEKDRLYVQSMDSAHVVIFEINLDKSWFTEYNFSSSNEEIIIGINALILAKVLQTRDKGQNISLSLDVDTDDKLNVVFTGNEKEFDKHFQLSLIDIESEQLQIPEFNHNIGLSMPSGKFSSIIQQLQIFGDTMEFKCANDIVTASSLSPENGKLDVIIDKAFIKSSTLDNNDTLNIGFSLNRLHDIASYSKIAKEVNIFLTDCYPIKVEYSVGNGKGSMIFFLAPRIDD